MFKQPKSANSMPATNNTTIATTPSTAPHTITSVGTSSKKTRKSPLGSSLGLYRHLLGYMRGYFGKFLLTVIAMMVVAISEPAFARLMKPLIDKGFIDQNKTAIILTPLLVMVIFLVRAIAAYINETNSTWLSATIVEKMRHLMFAKLLHLPVSYYNDNNSGRILSRILFDVTQITDAGFNVITVTIRDGLTVIGLLGLLLYTDWQLTLFCLFTLPFVLLLVRALAHRLRKLTKYNQHQYGQMTQIITEAVQGQKVVKLFAGYDYETKRFDESILAIKTNNVKQSATSSLNSGLSQFLVACALAMILYFAAHKAHSSGFTAGDFISFITAMLLIFAPMKRITSVTQSLQRGLSAAQSVFEFLEKESEHDIASFDIATAVTTNNVSGNYNVAIDNVAIDQEQILQPVKSLVVRDNICFHNVSFSYLDSSSNNSTTLSNINLTLHAGKTIAIVGSSGSGKTTIANLLPRFYLPTTGAISIDGVNINQISLAVLRASIALVSQEVVLFNDTVFNNIAYGANAKNICAEKVQEAARLANALEFIEQLPEKFATLIGENGTRLSGGQKQRLAIARAILKNAPILILDEATSALDNQSEKLVQEALDRLANGRTTLIIAHRLSTIIGADHIVVMNQGKIVEQGAHDELLALNNVYANLYHHGHQFAPNTASNQDDN